MSENRLGIVLLRSTYCYQTGRDSHDRVQRNRYRFPIHFPSPKAESNRRPDPSQRTLSQMALPRRFPSVTRFRALCRVPKMTTIHPFSVCLRLDSARSLLRPSAKAPMPSRPQGIGAFISSKWFRLRYALLTSPLMPNALNSHADGKGSHPQGRRRREVPYGLQRADDGEGGVAWRLHAGPGTSALQPSVL